MREPRKKGLGEAQGESAVGAVITVVGLTKATKSLLRRD